MDRRSFITSALAAGLGGPLLLDQLITAEREIVTVIEGADASAVVTGAITAWLSEQHPNVQVEVHRGGQPLYPYLFGVE